MVDLDALAFKLVRYNGTNLVTEYSANFTDNNFEFVPNAWYEIAITPTLFSGQVIAYCELTKIENSTPDISFSVAVQNYGLAAGAAGIFSNKSYAYFSQLVIEA